MQAKRQKNRLSARKKRIKITRDSAKCLSWSALHTHSSQLLKPFLRSTGSKFLTRPLASAPLKQTPANYQVCRGRRGPLPRTSGASQPRKILFAIAPGCPTSGPTLPGEYWESPRRFYCNAAHFLRQRVLVSQKHSERPVRIHAAHRRTFFVCAARFINLQLESPGSRLPDRTGIALARNWAGR